MLLDDTDALDDMAETSTMEREFDERTAIDGESMWAASGTGEATRPLRSARSRRRVDSESPDRRTTVIGSLDGSHRIKQATAIVRGLLT